MVERKMETSAAPDVVVESCLGNLKVRGDATGEVRVLVEETEDELQFRRRGETVSVALPEDGTLVCPPGTHLTVKEVLGNLRVDGVTGELEVGTASANAAFTGTGPVTLQQLAGNLAVKGLIGGLTAQEIKGNAALDRTAGTVALQRVAGNLTAEDAEGELTVQEIKGNARVRYVEGKLTLRDVSGNLSADGLQGGLEAERVRGNVRLGPPFTPDATYRVEANGNLMLTLPPDADLSLSLRAAGRVHSSVPGLSLEADGQRFSAVLGSGGSRIEARVKGNVTVRSLEPGESSEVGAGLDELGAQIEWQVHEAVAELTTRLESSLGRFDGEAVRRRVTEATEQARRKAERAAERARMRAERAERRWRRASGEREQPHPKPASDEERLRVLRMVEEGRLTPEQATDLLAALEGE